jgi:hypothetical protein
MEKVYLGNSFGWKVESFPLSLTLEMFGEARGSYSLIKSRGLEIKTCSRISCSLSTNYLTGPISGIQEAFENYLETGKRS